MTALGRQEEWEDSPEGYPPDSAVQVVELARQLRLRDPRLTPKWVDITTDPEGAASRRRDAEAKA